MAGRHYIFEAPDRSWVEDAACRDDGIDTDLFYEPNYAEMKDEREAREKAAKTICRACVVQEKCLSYALTTREDHGIWGGLTEIERRRVRRRRGAA